MMSKVRTSPLHEATRRIRGMLFAPQIVSLVVGIVLAYILLLLGELAGLKALGVRTNGSGLAFLVGFMLATFLCVVMYGTIVFTGAANYLTGGLAERWTKRELASLGPAWRIFSNVPFSVGFGDRSYEVDVDHIVVGPYGVLVVETKFTSLPLDLDADPVGKQVSEAMVQVEDNAGRVRALLHQVDSDLPIRPVVVFWGRQVRSPQASIRRVEGRTEDVRIIHGGRAKEWRPKLVERQVLTGEAVARVSKKIEAYVARTESLTRS